MNTSAIRPGNNYTQIRSAMQKHGEEIVQDTLETMKRLGDKETMQAMNQEEGLDAFRTRAEKALEDASVRKQTQKAIVHIMQELGFSVKKKNIKRRNNYVYILAQKDGGAYAEFNLFSDERFLYAFKSEEQDLKKESRLFREKLETVYDVDVESETVTSVGIRP